MVARAAGRMQAGTAWLVGLIFLVVLLNYVDRGAIGVGAPLIKPEMGLSATEFGVAVSAFFWIYAPAQFAVGWAIDRWCVYRLLAAGVVLWALSTAATALAGGIGLLIAVRLALGLGEAFTFPAANKVIARYVPAERRGMANAAVAAGLSFGPAVGTFAGGMIAARYGWRPMFVIFGAVTLFWVLPWLAAARRLPDYDPAQRDAPVPLGRIMGQRPVWAMGIVHLAATFGHYFALTWFPLWLVQNRGLSMVAMTNVATLGLLAQAASAIAQGLLSDRLVRAGWEEGRVRKGFVIGSHLLYAGAIYGLLRADGLEATTLWIIIVGIATAASTVHNYAVSQMFAGPRAAGSFVGFQNGLGNMSGIVGPPLIGWTIDQSGNYETAFLLAAAVSLAGALAWLVLVPKVRPIDLADPKALPAE